MKKAIAIVIQIIIFVGTWFAISNQIMDNTYFGFVSYDVDVIAENIRWILVGAACMSILNIWVWWPRKVVNTPAQTSTEDTKGVKVTEDPAVPKMD